MTASFSFPEGELGYGEQVRHALPALHRGFLAVNRYFAVPALRAGLGAVFSTPVGGYLMLLRTKGRTSGQVREAPLGYAIMDGAVYCVAGFGRRTHWFRNIEADPQVEVVLPGRAFAGLAEEVTDPAEYLPKMRRVLVRSASSAGGRWGAIRGARRTRSSASGPAGSRSFASAPPASRPARRIPVGWHGSRCRVRRCG